MLVKRRAVTQFLTELSQAIGEACFVVHNYWEADLTATGVAAPDDAGRLAHVRSIGRGRFDVILERASQPGSDLPYQVVGTWEKLSIRQAIEAVRCHIAPHGGESAKVVGPQSLSGDKD